jgi:hypothetical protein
MPGSAMVLVRDRRRGTTPTPSLRAAPHRPPPHRLSHSGHVVSLLSGVCRASPMSCRTSAEVAEAAGGCTRALRVPSEGRQSARASGNTRSYWGALYGSDHSTTVMLTSPPDRTGRRGAIERADYLIDRFRVRYEFGGGWACGCADFAARDACKHTREAAGRHAAQVKIAEHIRNGAGVLSSRRDDVAGHPSMTPSKAAISMVAKVEKVSEIA